jgi:hypothetical protein
MLSPSRRSKLLLTEITNNLTKYALLLLILYFRKQSLKEVYWLADWPAGWSVGRLFKEFNFPLLGTVIAL